MTERAKQVLSAVRVIFAEDTRETKKLMQMYAISAEGKLFFSLGKHNEKEASMEAVRFLESGESVALVSDRGTPGISDPGASLTQEAGRRGFRLVPVPGVSAIAALWSVAGITDSRFLFVGFFPEENKARENLKEIIASGQLATIFYESPQRILKTLHWLKEHFPKGEIILGREMTKAFEQFYRFNLADLDQQQIEERGEFSGVLVPHWDEPAPQPIDRFIRLRQLSEKDWAKEIAPEVGLTSKEVYNALQAAKNQQKLKEST
jgi:16S rRNA (cytidine1402-2'-O)-methyltransferase